ncbi:MAG: hypothetical protein R3C59_01815 [Planctomycetaceae bacterium]
MNLPSRPNRRANTRRRQQHISAPAEIETFESRLLLTTVPGILTPTGTIDVAAEVAGAESTVQFSWEAVDNAVSYEIWVSSLESFQRIDVPELQTPVTDTTIDVPVTSLSQGRMRVWARANLADGTRSAWSSGRDFRLNVTPTVTGPVGVEPRHLTPTDTPEIQWASANGVRRFQIWMTDVSTGEVRRFSVDNLTPILDADGDPVLDANGDQILQEVRSYQIPDSSDLPMGRYRVWVRSLGQDGTFSRWSQPYTFDAGPRPDNLSPAAPTFYAAPLLTWDAVTGATEYEVLVIDRNRGGLDNPLYEEEIVDTNSFQIPENLRTGEYSFWVRAIREDILDTDAATSTEIVTGPIVYGAWSAESRFRTLIPPTITGPTGEQGFVTSPRPTIEWTEIHGAATYDVLIHKFNSKPPFLSTRSIATNFTVPADLPEGSYTVWVRAIDTQGRLSSWSQPLTFQATGGAPVITAPEPNEVVDFPIFSWVGRSDAVSYTIWVAQIGGDFTFINVDGITGTSFQPIDPALPGSAPLPDGTYRVWVRAVLVDGSTSAWSAPVDFIGGIASTESSDDVDTSLVSLNLNVVPDVSDMPEKAAVRQPDDTIPARAANQQDIYAAVVSPQDDAGAQHAADTAAPGGDDLPTDVITQLAARCVDAEWWDASAG